MKPRDELLTLKDAMQLSRGDIRELYALCQFWDGNNDEPDQF